MCGRYALNRGLGQLRQMLNVRAVQTNGQTFLPSNNVAPGTIIPVVQSGVLNLVAWGDTLHDKLCINAKSEMVVSKFKASLQERRILVPADGYFEWDKGKQPFFFHPPGHELFFFAGVLTDAGKCLIITRQASQKVAVVHHRMPVMMTIAQSEQWLGDSYASVLNSPPFDLDFYPVARQTLKIGYNGNECIMPLKPSKRQPTLFDVGIKKTVEEPSQKAHELKDSV